MYEIIKIVSFVKQKNGKFFLFNFSPALLLLLIIYMLISKYHMVPIIFFYTFADLNGAMLRVG